MCEVCNCAEDNTLYSSNEDLEIVFKNLETGLNVLAWFNTH